MNYFIDSEPYRLVNQAISLVTPGRYRLKDLAGKSWSKIYSKTLFGRYFKIAVKQGLVPGVQLSGRTVENHSVYEIGKPFQA